MKKISCCAYVGKRLAATDVGRLAATDAGKLAANAVLLQGKIRQPSDILPGSAADEVQFV